MNELKEFIKRCQVELKPAVQKRHQKEKNKTNQWNRENKEKLKECQARYFATPRGKQKRREVSARRVKRMGKARAGLTKEERWEIELFYLNRPEGYVVDHIIPISRGGRHHISNLQYLTPEENASKGHSLPE